MTDYDDDDIDIYEMTLDELESLEMIEELAPDMTQYNISSEKDAKEILESYRGLGARAQFHVHDQSTGLMLPIAQKSGIGVDYLLDRMGEDKASLSEELRSLAPKGEIGNIDFFQIIVIEK